MFSPVDCPLSLVDRKSQWRTLSLTTSPVSSLPVWAAFLWHGLGCPGQVGGEEAPVASGCGELISAGTLPSPCLKEGSGDSRKGAALGDQCSEMVQSVGQGGSLATPHLFQAPCAGKPFYRAPVQALGWVWL